LIFSVVLFAAALAASAQPYPAKPVRLVVTFPAGGAADVLARTLTVKLADALGQPVVVDNRPGAGGNVGAEAVAKAPADGYTVLFGTNGTHGINPALYGKVPYDPVKDFAPVALAQTLPSILVVNPSVPASSLRELLDYVRARPGKIDYASAGNGTTSHFAAELMKVQAKLYMVHIPYRGGAAAIADVIAGRVPVMIQTAPDTLPQMRAGKLRALAITSEARSPLAPDIPTMAESGLPGYEVTSWTGVLAPAGTPREAVDALAAALAKVAADPDYRERLAKIGAEPAHRGPAEFAAYIQTELAKWAQAVKASGARVD
jgi:tripartite-type tricarboxylate transporter receptor subunit TctC